MRELIFRGDPAEEAERIFQIRELIRGRKGFMPMPTGQQGFVVEDLDLVLRWYGEKYGLDDKGRLRLIELRREGKDNGYLGGSKNHTLGWMDEAFWSYHGVDRYDGLFVVEHSDDNADEGTTFWVNKEELDVRGFLSWCQNPFSHIDPKDLNRQWSKAKSNRA